jgi:signal transduction histidine kinase
MRFVVALLLLFFCRLTPAVAQEPGSGGDSYREQLNVLSDELEDQQSFINWTNFRQRLYILVIVLVVVFSAVIIFYFRVKQKGARNFSNTIVNKLEEERSRIARDLHDGIGQSIIVLKNRFNKLKVDDSAALDQINNGFSEILEEIRGISRSLIPPELKRLGLRKAIENRVNEMSSTGSILITTDIGDLDKVMLDDQKSLRIYRIIQELTTNTLKHSDASAAKLEAIVFSRLLTLVYQDNGIGLEKEKWYTSDNSIGLRSILQRIDSLNGTIKIEQPKKGIKVIMKIHLS